MRCTSHLLNDGDNSLFLTEENKQSPEIQKVVEKIYGSSIDPELKDSLISCLITEGAKYSDNVRSAVSRMFVSIIEDDSKQEDALRLLRIAHPSNEWFSSAIRHSHYSPGLRARLFPFANKETQSSVLEEDEIEARNIHDLVCTFSGTINTLLTPEFHKRPQEVMEFLATK